MSDASVCEVRKIIPVFILIGNIYLSTKILRGETNFNVIICLIFDKIVNSLKSIHILKIYGGV